MRRGEVLKQSRREQNRGVSQTVGKLNSYEDQGI